MEKSTPSFAIRTEMVELNRNKYNCPLQHVNIQARFHKLHNDIADSSAFGTHFAKKPWRGHLIFMLHLGTVCLQYMFCMTAQAHIYHAAAPCKMALYRSAFILIIDFCKYFMCCV